MQCTSLPYLYMCAVYINVHNSRRYILPFPFPLSFYSSYSSSSSCRQIVRRPPPYNLQQNQPSGIPFPLEITSIFNISPFNFGNFMFQLNNIVEIKDWITAGKCIYQKEWVSVGINWLATIFPTFYEPSTLNNVQKLKSGFFFFKFMIYIYLSIAHCNSNDYIGPLEHIWHQAA